MYEFLLELLYHFDLVFRLDAGKEAPDMPQTKRQSVRPPEPIEGDSFLVPSMLPEFPSFPYEEIWGGPQVC